MEKLNSFVLHNQSLPVKFIETTPVTSDVNCDVYEFVGDTSKDLGIISIDPESKTPLQEILKGDKTIEGYISGKGMLTVIKPTGEKLVFPVDPTIGTFEQTVDIGDKMQWESSKDSHLIVYEVCYPPYEEGRFKNL